MAVKKFRVDSFVTDVKNHIEASENALSWLMNAYLWAGEHLKEIHRRWPDYTQEWLVSEIQRVYNINPVVYARTLRTLGNGTDNAATQRGFNAMNKFGVWECTRADRLLDRESVQQLATEIEIIPDAEAFRKRVTTLSNKLKKIKPPDDVKPRGISIDLETLRIENAKLKTRVRELMDENEILRRRLDEISSIVSNATAKA